MIPRAEAAGSSIGKPRQNDKEGPLVYVRQAVDVGGIHVQLAVADLDCQETEAAVTILSTEELARAFRFRTSQLFARFVAGRALLKQILASHLDCDPGDISLTQNEHGKPMLALFDQPRVEFNVSHSSNIFVMGVVNNHRIGIDVEGIDCKVDRDLVAQSVFGQAELSTYDRLKGRERLIGFANGWTRKEAFVKCLGEGLHCDLKAFDVTLSPVEAPAVLRTSPKHGVPADFSVLSFSIDAGHIGALVVDRRACGVVEREGCTSPA